MFPPRHLNSDKTLIRMMQSADDEDHGTRSIEANSKHSGNCQYDCSVVLLPALA